jgi:hypothetical protein
VGSSTSHNPIGLHGLLQDSFSPLIFYSKQNVRRAFARFVFSALFCAEEFQYILLSFSKLEPAIFALGHSRRTKIRGRKGRGSKENSMKVENKT